MENSLFEQNFNLNKINSNRVISRSFKRQLGNDRFLKIPTEVKIQKTEIFHLFYLFSILNNIHF